MLEPSVIQAKNHHIVFCLYTHDNMTVVHWHHILMLPHMLGLFAVEGSNFGSLVIKKISQASSCYKMMLFSPRKKIGVNKNKSEVVLLNTLCLPLRMLRSVSIISFCKWKHHVTGNRWNHFSQGDQYLVTLLRLCLIFTTSKINRGSFRSPLWLLVMTDNGCCLSSFSGQFLPLSHNRNVQL